MSTSTMSKIGWRLLTIKAFRRFTDSAHLFSETRKLSALACRENIDSLVNRVLGKKVSELNFIHQEKPALDYFVNEQTILKTDQLFL